MPSLLKTEVAFLLPINLFLPQSYTEKTQSDTEFSAYE